MYFCISIYGPIPEANLDWVTQVEDAVYHFAATTKMFIGSAENNEPPFSLDEEELQELESLEERAKLGLLSRPEQRIFHKYERNRKREMELEDEVALLTRPPPLLTRPSPRLTRPPPLLTRPPPLVTRPPPLFFRH